MKQVMRARMAMVLVCALTLAAGLAINASAQEKPAKIHGQVLDVSGNGFAGVLVTVRNTTTNQSTDFIADAQGRYRSGNLAAGT